MSNFLISYKFYFFFVLIFLLTSSCTVLKIDDSNKVTQRIVVRGNQFFKGEKPYYFIGANYWYGPLIAAKKSGDRRRLIRELNIMKRNGIDNLRILVGAEGSGSDYQVRPTLQYEQGKYNQDLLDGLDFLLHEMKKRNMYAVLYLNNNWIWSGGMSTYLYWNGYGKVPNPFKPEHEWEEFMNYTSQFVSCTPCKKAYYNHIKFILSRTNKYNNQNYNEDPTIMSWQVANEPRVMGTVENEKHYASWLLETVSLLNSLSKEQLISTGSEGKASYFQDINMFERLHKSDKIDYLTMHMWPKNWSWYDPNNESKSTLNSIEKGLQYMNEHIEISNKLNKPIVMSEFGFPREKESLSKKSSVKNRNLFFNQIIEQVILNKKSDGSLAGLNFWGFGGIAKNNPNEKYWSLGDDFTADPPQEPQGLNTVFAKDKSTLELIKKGNEFLMK